MYLQKWLVQFLHIQQNGRSFRFLEFLIHLCFNDFDAKIHNTLIGLKKSTMKENEFKVSFTTGGLYFQEAIKIASLYLQCRDWSEVTEKSIKENVLQARTGNSAVRTSREVIQRVQTLSEDQLALLVEGNLADQKQILWLAVCKHYPLI